jgi:hypothetical protein
MSHRSLLAGVVALAVIAVSATPAGAVQKYKFSFVGTTSLPALAATWQWPPNQFNRGRRDDDSFAVLSGRGCGTRPNKAVWRLRLQTGELPAYTLKIDFVHNSDQKNPAPVVNSRYSGTPAANIKFTVRFPALPSQVTLVAKPTGDVANLQLLPATSKIKRTRVSHC